MTLIFSTWVTRPNYSEKVHFKGFSYVKLLLRVVSSSVDMIPIKETITLQVMQQSQQILLSQSFTFSVEFLVKRSK